MITAEYLRERLDYNPHTGDFVWLDHPDFPPNWRSTYIGMPAGSTNGDGYRQIRMNGKRYKAHRLAWLYVHGVEPASFIDHKDRDRSNNAIGNLRLSTNSDNMKNRVASKRNKSGVKNVVAHSSGKWQVQIKSAKKTYYFGTFQSVEEARIVADRERARLHGEFSRAA